ncbi:MAG: hypothetical protein Q7R83_04475 [bacterium]|nr:hypothetical protein [bacterium]
MTKIGSPSQNRSTTTPQKEEIMKKLSRFTFIAIALFGFGVTGCDQFGASGLNGAVTCSDGAQNGTETDIDCGGSCAKKCAGDQGCVHGTDCASGVCANQKCTGPAATCTDGKQNGNETDVDCGDGCSPCANGKFCRGGADCVSARCANGQCEADPATNQPTCSDTVKNGFETDIDCGGGTCGSCVNGKTCLAARDCQTGNCANGQCQAAAQQGACNDVVKNGNETDIDCGGGTCAACVQGKYCLAARDCQSGNCINNSCQAVNNCADVVKNGNETDIDCGGGACAQCANGKACLAARDCTSGNCVNGVCGLNVNACGNAAKDGNETDVDCGGGTCTACVNGKNCFLARDCSSGYCLNNVCTVQNNGSCNDGVKNGAETGVDCGGNVCARCANGLGCSQNSDCANNLCSGGICQGNGNNCNNSLRDGAETDVDCGGGTCVDCANGRMCQNNGDCLSSLCSGGICQAQQGQNATCFDLMQNGNEVGVDCGGACKLCYNQDCSTDDQCKSGYCSPWARRCEDRPAGIDYPLQVIPTGQGWLAAQCNGAGAILEGWGKQSDWHEAAGRNQTLAFTLHIDALTGYVAVTAHCTAGVMNDDFNLQAFDGQSAGSLSIQDMRVMANNSWSSVQYRGRVCKDVYYSRLFPNEPARWKLFIALDPNAPSCPQ